MSDQPTEPTEQARNATQDSNTDSARHSLFDKDGAVGKQFESDGNIGKIGETVGGPFASDGAIGKQFTAEGLIGGSVQSNLGDQEPK